MESTLNKKIEINNTKFQDNDNILLFLENKYQAKEHNVDYIKIIHLWSNFYRINFHGEKSINKTDEKETKGIVVKSYFIRVDENSDGYVVFNYEEK